MEYHTAAKMDELQLQGHMKEFQGWQSEKK
jgi:hypothetical protein